MSERVEWKRKRIEMQEDMRRYAVERQKAEGDPDRLYEIEVFEKITRLGLDVSDDQGNRKGWIAAQWSA
jgi:hypothetical protein